MAGGKHFWFFSELDWCWLKCYLSIPDFHIINFFFPLAKSKNKILVVLILFCDYFSYIFKNL